MKAFTDTSQTKEQAIYHAGLWRRKGMYFAFGRYWDGEKGNVSGGMYHEYLNSVQTVQDCPYYACTVHGIPTAVAGIIDVFFSGLSCIKDDDNNCSANLWAESVYEAIPVGADLSKVADKMVMYVLENPEWLAAYADEKAAHLTGLMHGIFKIRLLGHDQSLDLKNFYYDHMHNMHRHQLQGHRDHSRYVNGALKAISEVNSNMLGEHSFFFKGAVSGSSRNLKIHHGERWRKLSEIFLQMLRDS